MEVIDTYEAKCKLRETCEHEDVQSRGTYCKACGSYDGVCIECGQEMYDNGYGWKEAGEFIEVEE